MANLNTFPLLKNLLKKFKNTFHTSVYKVDHKDLLWSTGKSAQCLVITYMGRKSEKQ